MTDLKLLRMRLLELHKSLIEAERTAYEARHGRVSANAFWHALTSDPSLAWLTPLSAAIVRFDELLDLHSAGAPADGLSDQLASLRDLLQLAGTGEFADRYGALVDRSPDVAFAHAALHSLLDPPGA